MNPLAAQQGIIILILVASMFLSRGFQLDRFIESLIFGLPGLLVGLTFHEFAHAWAADKLGDPTPRQQGRLSLDIRKHIDPIGLILLFIVQFGWAKPVETDLRNLKKPKRDMALIALAGPVMNVIIALMAAIVLAKTHLGYKAELVAFYFFAYNAGLAVFNMIPVPPLDGSKIITAFMSNKTYYKYLEFEYKYQMPLFLVLIFLMSTNILLVPLKFFVGLIYTIGLIIAQLLPF